MPFAILGKKRQERKESAQSRGVTPRSNEQSFILFIG
jgi:hypothetical protein